MKNFMRLIFTAVTIMLVTGAAMSLSAQSVLHRGEGGEPGTLDPHQASGTWENAIVGDMFLGLVTEDAEAKAIPGAATSWEITPDGKVYTFHLRRGAKWSDGVDVTAADFEFSFKRILGPTFAAKYANLLYPIKNAEAVKTKKLPVDKLGVKAIDKYTLEVTLEASTPYFLAQLKHYTAFPVPKHAVEKYGKDWVKPGNLVSNGAFTVVEWLPQTYVKSAKNKLFYDAKNVKFDEVYYYPTEDRSAALKRFRAGEIDMNNDFPTEQYKWLKKNLADETIVAPYLGIYYYPINHRLKKLQDKRVREALSLAVNRKIITEKVLTTGEVPAYSFVPPIAGFEIAEAKFKSMSMKARIARAKKLMKAAGFSKSNPLDIQLRYNTSENHKKVAIAVASMWKQIFVKTELFNSEVAVHYNDIEVGKFEVARAGWIGDYADPQNFLMLLEYPNQLNYGAWDNAEFNKLMKQAAVTVDLKERAKLLTKAEAIAMSEIATMPIYYYVSKRLVSKKLKGYKSNIEDIHRSRWMWK